MGARVLLWCGSSRDRRHLSRVEAYYVAGGAIATHPTPPTPLPCAQSFYDQDLLAGVAPSAAHLMLGGETVRPLPLADRRIHCLPCRIRPCSLFSSLQEMWGETADGERPFRAAIRAVTPPSNPGHFCRKRRPPDDLPPRRCRRRAPVELRRCHELWCSGRRRPPPGLPLPPPRARHPRRACHERRCAQRAERPRIMPLAVVAQPFRVSLGLPVRL